VPNYLAVDLGATSGRVVNVIVEQDRIELDTVRRFPNHVIAEAGGLSTWPFEYLMAEIGTGLSDGNRRCPARSVAVDSWGVDYGLLDTEGRLFGPVHAYRSRRTDGVMDDVAMVPGRRHIYGITGIQFLRFNTLYQLIAAKESLHYRAARSLLMVPDLVNHFLCGSTTNDVTNASTTQLLDANTREWSDDLVRRADLRRDLLPALHAPGTHLGSVSPNGIAPAVSGLAVVAAASHDTASAVVGTPLRVDRPGIYISCGTWALVGCELDAPVTTDAAFAANVTNEVGINGTTRLLKNVCGLWLLEECRRAWSAQGSATELTALIASAERVPSGRAVFDPDHSSLAMADDMPVAIRALCLASGQPAPSSAAELTRTILDSLALSFRRTVRTIETVAGIHGDVVHLVGGGSSNHLLARLCASACERTVLAGPAEATVVGNALVQAIADGSIADLVDGRRLIEASLPPRVFHSEPIADWQSLETRLWEGAPA
jgi:rhamnulokinase